MRYKKLNILLCIALTSIITILNVLLSKYMGNFVNESLKYHTKNVIYYGSLALIVLILSIFIQNIYGIFVYRSTNKIILDIKKKQYENILKNKYNENNEEYINIINNNFEQFRINNLEGFFYILSCIIKISIFSIAFIRLNIYLFSIFFVITILNVFFVPFFKNRMKAIKSKYILSSNSYYKNLKDYIMGIRTIKAYDDDNKFLDNLVYEDKKMENNKSNDKIFETTTNLITSLSVMASQILCMIFATYFVSKKKITIGDVIYATQLINYLTLPIKTVLAKIIQFMSTKKLLKKYIIDEISNKKVSKYNFNTIIYKNVKLENRIKNFSHEFGDNKKYVLIGKSGIGKTSILEAIFSKKYAGEIYCGEKSNLQIEGENIYSNLVYQRQDDYLFDMSVKDNICLFQNLDYRDIVNYLELDKLLDKNISELSSGEKRRVILARAFIRKANIYLFDEPCANQDIKMSKKIIEYILNLNATVICISHLGKEYLEKFDEIIEIS